jgi:glucan 1,3-beta-glucosidase
MCDLVFIGGNRGAFLGNQQFTSRNLTFTGCNTAIFMNFDWVWTFKGLTITDCKIGIDISNGGTDELATGSIVVLDSTIYASTAGIITNYIPGYSSPGSANTLVVENVDFRQSSIAIANSNDAVILEGGTIVASFGQGNAYTTAGEAVNGQNYNGTSCTYSNTTQTAYSAQETRIQQQLAPITRSPNLVDSTGSYFARSRPQYENYPSSSFLSAKGFGCAGNGVRETGKICAYLSNHNF